MRWIVERIDRLEPVVFAQFRRNEVSLKASIDRDYLRRRCPPAARGAGLEGPGS